MRTRSPQAPSQPSTQFPSRSAVATTSASATRSPKPQSSFERSQSFAPLFTVICDVMILLVTIGLGLLLHVLVVVVWPATASPFDGQMLEWMPFWAITSTAAWYLVVDLLRCGYSRAHLPFNYPQRDVRRFYWERLELILSTIATCLLLLCLCILMPGQPLISKLFLAAITALTAFAVRQTIPSRRQAFAASTSVFSMAMLVVAIASKMVS